MRLFHLADLHIGKKVNQVDMLDEQSLALDQVLGYIESYQPDALILAGDIYDRRNPPLDALHLLDQFLNRVILDYKVPVLAVGGNHDSGARLDYGNHLLAQVGLHMEGSLQLPVPIVRLNDAHGPVDFHLLPFADLTTLQHVLEEGANRDYGELMRRVLNMMELDPTARHVLVHHGMVLGLEPAITSDSERDLFIGGTDYWRSDRLQEFSYVALGHLHRAQAIMSPHIRYSGSIVKYSFSEETHQKQILCVDLSADGKTEVASLPLTPARDLITLTGHLEELLACGPEYAPHRDSYVRVILKDRGALLEPMNRLRKVYPHIMTLEWEGKDPSGLDLAKEDSPRLVRETSPLDLFKSFYETIYNEEPTAAQNELVARVFQEVQGGLS